MGAVGLVFAPLAPLVVVAAAIVFWMSSCVYKYQLMFVFVTKVESGGVGVSFLAPSMFAYNSCIPSAYLERRNQSSAILRSPYAGLNDFE